MTEQSTANRNSMVKVLKSGHVRISGSVRLEPQTLCRGGRMQHPATQPVPRNSGAAQEVRILESNNEYAIIEVVCSCGARSHVQCNYADMAGVP